MIVRIWRRGSESNRRPRLCRPLHNHSATPPPEKALNVRPDTKKGKPAGFSLDCPGGIGARNSQTPDLDFGKASGTGHDSPHHGNERNFSLFCVVHRAVPTSVHTRAGRRAMTPRLTRVAPPGRATVPPGRGSSIVPGLRARRSCPARRYGQGRRAPERCAPAIWSRRTLSPRG